MPHLYTISEGVQGEDVLTGTCLCSTPKSTASSEKNFIPPHNSMYSSDVTIRLGQYLDGNCGTTHILFTPK